MELDSLVYPFMLMLVVIGVIVTYITGRRMEKEGVGKK